MHWNPQAPRPPTSTAATALRCRCRCAPKRFGASAFCACVGCTFNLEDKTLASHFFAFATLRFLRPRPLILVILSRRAPPRPSLRPSPARARRPSLSLLRRTPDERALRPPTPAAGRRSYHAMAAFHSLSSSAAPGDGMSLNSAAIDGLDSSIFDESLL